MTLAPRPPVPPFDEETAALKARTAEDAWNSRDPVRVARAYTPDSRWRNRDEIFSGTDAIIAFLTRKWQRELDYRLIKEVWAFRDRDRAPLRRNGFMAAVRARYTGCSRRRVEWLPRTSRASCREEERGTARISLRYPSERDVRVFSPGGGFRARW